jgi:hypothetical protein
LVIDGGSRPDFATVMIKIMQTGIAPKQIQALVYQHYDPDLCGSYGKNWELYLRLTDACLNCRDYASCAGNLPDCPVVGILHFHKKIMTSTRALRYALEIISKIPFEIIAPQHGSIINDKVIIRHVFGLLGSLGNVGIDEIIDKDYEPDLSSFDQRLDSR